jgi:hypothetical protein
MFVRTTSMTASVHTRSSEAALPGVPGTAPVDAAVAREMHAQRRMEWRIFAILIAVISALYLLLYNIYWVPGGDSELYVAVARNLAKGNGYIYNGQPVNISPPGWPWVLSLVMLVSPYFATMKLVTLVCMVGALGLWYWVMLRFTRPRTAALVVLLTALLSHVYTLSFWMHSDALFLLVAAGAMVVAFQINENKPHYWVRVVALLLLCAAAVFVRWAGVLQWPLLAGILLRGQMLPLSRDAIAVLRRRINSDWLYLLKPNPQWLAVILSLVVTLGTFIGLREAMALTPEQAKLAREAGVEFGEDMTEVVPDEAETLALITIETRPEKRELTVAEQIQKRILDAGRWFSWLLWQPMRFVAALKAFSWIDRLLGWTVIACLVMTVIRAIPRRQWIWPAVGMYCAVLCLNWPNPNARYLVPVAPLIIWGVVAALSSMALPSWPRVRRFAIYAFIGMILLCNSALYAIEVRVARSDNFYEMYEGGLHTSLISACHYLNQYQLRDRDLGVSNNYQNLGRTRRSKFGMRATIMLTEHVVLETQKGLSRRFCGRLKFWQEPVSPWRVWHFRLPAWLQERLSDVPVERETAGWVLYRLRGGQLYEVPVPPVTDWPTRVPGFDLPTDPPDRPLEPEPVAL